MEVSGQPHAPAISPPDKQHPVLTEQKAGWAPDPRYGCFWRRKTHTALFRLHFIAFLIVREELKSGNTSLFMVSILVLLPPYTKIFSTFPSQTASTHVLPTQNNR
jgi:hypothetical protein